jgi:hypothetical protein
MVDHQGIFAFLSRPTRVRDHKDTSNFVGDKFNHHMIEGRNRVNAWRGKGNNLRDNLILQATDEKRRHLCDVGQNRLTGPDLVA